MALHKYNSTIDDTRWMLGDGAVLATPVTSASEVFGSLQQQFRNMACNVVKVWSVENPRRQFVYEQQRKLMANKWRCSPEEVHEKKMLFHSTSAPLGAVLVEGLRCDFAKNGLYGKGIYATPSVAKASTYWKMHFNRRIMLCVSVLVGLPHVVPPDVLSCSHLTLPPDGLDSVLAFRKSIPENVVFCDDQVLITHFVDYEVTSEYSTRATNLLLDPIGSLLKPFDFQF